MFNISAVIVEIISKLLTGLLIIRIAGIAFGLGAGISIAPMINDIEAQIMNTITTLAIIYIFKVKEPTYNDKKQ